jgi:hypothetical protein
MIIRADGGRNQGNPADAPSHGRNRSGPVEGRGLSLRPPRMARVVPGRRPAHFSGSRSGSTTVFAVEQMRAARDQSAVAGLSGEKREAPGKRAGRRLATAGMGY